jgi:hypothetical protein
LNACSNFKPPPVDDFSFRHEYCIQDLHRGWLRNDYSNNRLRMTLPGIGCTAQEPSKARAMNPTTSLPSDVEAG